MRRHWGFWIAALAFCALCVAAACMYGTPRREARAAAAEPFANAGDYDLDEGAADDPVLGDPVNRNGRRGWRGRGPGSGGRHAGSGPYGLPKWSHRRSVYGLPATGSGPGSGPGSGSGSSSGTPTSPAGEGPPGRPTPPAPLPTPNPPSEPNAADGAPKPGDPLPPAVAAGPVRVVWEQLAPRPARASGGADVELLRDTGLAVGPEYAAQFLSRGSGTYVLDADGDAVTEVTDAGSGRVSLPMTMSGDTTFRFRLGPAAKGRRMDELIRARPVLAGAAGAGRGGLGQAPWVMETPTATVERRASVGEGGGVFARVLPSDTGSGGSDGRSRIGGVLRVRASDPGQATRMRRGSLALDPADALPAAKAKGLLSLSGAVPLKGVAVDEAGMSWHALADAAWTDGDILLKGVQLPDPGSERRSVRVTVSDSRGPLFAVRFPGFAGGGASDGPLSGYRVRDADGSRMDARGGKTGLTPAGSPAATAAECAAACDADLGCAALAWDGNAAGTPAGCRLLSEGAMADAKRGPFPSAADAARGDYSEYVRLSTDAAGRRAGRPTGRTRAGNRVAAATDLASCAAACKADDTCDGFSWERSCLLFSAGGVAGGDPRGVSVVAASPSSSSAPQTAAATAANPSQANLSQVPTGFVRAPRDPAHIDFYSVASGGRACSALCDADGGACGGYVAEDDGGTADSGAAGSCRLLPPVTAEAYDRTWDFGTDTAFSRLWLPGDMRPARGHTKAADSRETCALRCSEAPASECAGFAWMPGLGDTSARCSTFADVPSGPDDTEAADGAAAMFYRRASTALRDWEVDGYGGEDPGDAAALEGYIPQPDLDGSVLSVAGTEHLSAATKEACAAKCSRYGPSHCAGFTFLQEPARGTSDRSGAKLQCLLLPPGTDPVGEGRTAAAAATTYMTAAGASAAGSSRAQPVGTGKRRLVNEMVAESGNADRLCLATAGSKTYDYVPITARRFSPEATDATKDTDESNMVSFENMTRVAGKNMMSIKVAHSGKCVQAGRVADTSPRLPQFVAGAHLKVGADDRLTAFQNECSGDPSQRWIVRQVDDRWERYESVANPGKCLAASRLDGGTAKASGQYATLLLPCETGDSMDRNLVSSGAAPHRTLWAADNIEKL